MDKEIIEGLDSYLSFQLGAERFAVNIGHVKQILGMTTINRVPHVPDYYKGVINLFGDVLPVIDGRLKFRMPEKNYDKNTCIIVLMFSAQEKITSIGLIVDQVHQVVQISKDQLKEPPEVGNKYRNELIQAIAQLDEKFLIILNVEKVFSLEELDIINPNES